MGENNGRYWGKRRRLAALLLELQLAKGQFVHLIDEVTDTLGGLDKRIMGECTRAKLLFELCLLSLQLRDAGEDALQFLLLGIGESYRTP